jgi:predicted TIM-barrel fold metal-dependent hydrolase
MTPPIVDAHQHFWDPTRFDYPWMTDEVAVLRRRFYQLADLRGPLVGTRHLVHDEPDPEWLLRHDVTMR